MPRALVAGFVLVGILGSGVAAHAQTAPPVSPPPQETAPLPGDDAGVGSPEPAPSPEATPAPPDFEEPEKPPWWNLIGRIRYAISQWFSNLVTAALRPVFDLLGRTVFATPEFHKSSRTAELWGFLLVIADGLLVLLAMVGAGIVTAGGGLLAQMSAKELLPRVVFAAIAANLSLILIGELIAISNALSRGMLGAALEPADVAGLMIKMLANAALGNPFLALFALGIVVIAVLVVATYVIRIAAMTVLVVSAPLVLVGHATPQSEGWARAWWRALFALLVAPVAQSLLLAITFRVVLTNDSILGLPIGSGFIDVLVVGTLIYFLYKVPIWCLNAAMAGAGSRTVVRVKAFAQKAVARA